MCSCSSPGVMGLARRSGGPDGPPQTNTRPWSRLAVNSRGGHRGSLPGSKETQAPASRRERSAPAAPGLISPWTGATAGEPELRTGQRPVDVPGSNGIDAPTHTASMCQSGDSYATTQPNMSVHHEDYGSRHRPGQERVPSPRRERTRKAALKKQIKRDQMAAFFVNLQSCFDRSSTVAGGPRRAT
jgi:hypothetical protein